MGINPSSYRSIGNRSDWLVRFSVVTMILLVITIVATIYQTITIAYDLQFGYVFLIIGIFTAIISILLNIILMFWYYRATKNIHSFGAKEVTSPRMAVIWWLIPIAFLWKPYNVAQQIWKASSPEIKLTNGTEWKGVPNSNVVKRWWILMLATVFGSIFASVGGGVGFAQIYNSESVLSEESDQTASIISIPILVLNIISLIYFIRVVTQISTRQYHKSIGFV